MSLDPKEQIERADLEQFGLEDVFDRAGLAGPEHIVGTTMVIAPDIILDLVFAREERAFEAARLFDAIAQDIAEGVTTRKAFVAATTIPDVYAAVLPAAGLGTAQSVAHRLLKLVTVAPATNDDFRDALGWSSDVELSDAMQFATCQAVKAQYLVTNEEFGMKRAPVHRRRPVEMLPLFKREPRVSPEQGGQMMVSSARELDPQ